MDTPLPDIFYDIAIGVASTLISAILFYWLFRPQIQFRRKIQSRVWDIAPERFRTGNQVKHLETARLRYDVHLRSLGLLPLVSIQCEAWIQVWLTNEGTPDAKPRWTRIVIPVGDPGRPQQKRFFRPWHYPALRLEDIDWESHILKRPDGAFDLQSLLEYFQEPLTIIVTATTASIPVTRVQTKQFCAHDIATVKESIGQVRYRYEDKRCRCAGNHVDATLAESDRRGRVRGN